MLHASQILPKNVTMPLGSTSLSESSKVIDKEFYDHFYLSLLWSL